VRAFLYDYEAIGSDGTRRVYGGTMRALVDAYGASASVGDLRPETLVPWFRERFGGTSAATYDRHLATLRSAAKWWQLQGWIIADPTVGLTRRKINIDRTKARDQATVSAVWERDDIPLRDKTLMMMLYETAARAEEILSLNVEDLDRANKRARVRSKGGDIEWVYWQTGTARLLPRLIGDRERGPLFLAYRLPTRAVATVDLCPVTGRARLSYRRAAELCKQYTGWTLHIYRHSALSHDAGAGTSLPMLQARSRHASIRTLAERYAIPGAGAVARHVAEMDPARRRR
jgi:integrase/recombinase XerD